MALLTGSDTLKDVEILVLQNEVGSCTARSLARSRTGPTESAPVRRSGLFAHINRPISEMTQPSISAGACAFSLGSLVAQHDAKIGVDAPGSHGAAGRTRNTSYRRFGRGCHHAFRAAGRTHRVGFCAVPVMPAGWLSMGGCWRRAVLPGLLRTGMATGVSSAGLRRPAGSGVQGLDDVGRRLPA